VQWIVLLSAGDVCCALRALDAARGAAVALGPHVFSPLVWVLDAFFSVSEWADWVLDAGTAWYAGLHWASKLLKHRSARADHEPVCYCATLYLPTTMAASSNRRLKVRAADLCIHRIRPHFLFNMS